MRIGQKNYTIASPFYWLAKPGLLLSIFLLAQSLLGQELQRFTSYSDRLMDSFFSEDPKVDFNEIGMLRFKGEYNVLKMSVYGIVSYDRFIERKDSTYFHALENQYRYLRRESSYTLFQEGTALSYPYEFDYADLCAPWYSGLVNAAATSFLLRYYALTSDPEALKLAQKNVQFMILPVEQGGCLNLTENGLTWVEEYPNSSKMPQVMNGFLSAIIALQEYLQFDPDPEVRQVYENCLKSVKQSFPMFDKRNTTVYSQGKRFRVRNHYLKLQVMQLKHLYALTGDEDILMQSILWSCMSYQKDIDNGHVGYTNQGYDFAYQARFNQEKLNIDTTGYWVALAASGSPNQDKPDLVFLDAVYQNSEDTPKLKFKANLKTKHKALVFYRGATEAKGLKTTPFKYNQVYRGNRLNFKAPFPYFQLRVVFLMEEEWPIINQVLINEKASFIDDLNF